MNKTPKSDSLIITTTTTTKSTLYCTTKTNYYIICFMRILGSTYLYVFAVKIVGIYMHSRKISHFSEFEHQFDESL